MPVDLLVVASRRRHFCGLAAFQPNLFNMLTSGIFFGANLTQTKMKAITL